jgi:hypothetical protein
MKHVIPVEIAALQNIIDQYSSKIRSQILIPADLHESERILKDDLEKISIRKGVNYEIWSGNLMYSEGNVSSTIKIGWFPDGWEGLPNWQLCIPILNVGAVKLSYFKGNYTTVVEESTFSVHNLPKWVGEPELEESILISSPILMNTDTPFSYQNQSNSPAMLLVLRFNPSLLAV